MARRSPSDPSAKQPLLNFRLQSRPAFHLVGSNACSWPGAGAWQRFRDRSMGGIGDDTERPLLGVSAVGRSRPCAVVGDRQLSGNPNMASHPELIGYTSAATVCIAALPAGDRAICRRRPCHARPSASWRRRWGKAGLAGTLALRPRTVPVSEFLMPIPVAPHKLHVAANRL